MKPPAYEEHIMLNMQVTLQLSYGDLKLLEAAKKYGTQDPLEIKQIKQHTITVIREAFEEDLQYWKRISYDRNTVGYNPDIGKYGIVIIKKVLSKLDELHETV